MVKEKLTRERIVQETLTLIDEKGSSHALNLREIARHLGCSHQSLYNYFPTYGDLQLEALRTCVQGLRGAIHYRGSLTDFTGQLVDYATNHRGWYRFMWLDFSPHSFEAVVVDDQRPEAMLIDVIMNQEAPLCSRETLAMVLKASHNIVHGEICKFLAGRSAYADPSALKTAVIDQVSFIWEVGRNR